LGGVPGFRDLLPAEAEVLPVAGSEAGLISLLAYDD
jgi:hypothetical protein